MRWWDQCLLYFKLLSKLLTGRGWKGSFWPSHSQEMLAKKACITLSAKWNYNSHQTNVNLILSINLYMIFLHDRCDTNVELILLCIYSVLYKNIFSNCLFAKPNCPLCSWISPPTTTTHQTPPKRSISLSLGVITPAEVLGGGWVGGLV